VAIAGPFLRIGYRCDVRIASDVWGTVPNAVRRVGITRPLPAHNPKRMLGQFPPRSALILGFMPNLETQVFWLALIDAIVFMRKTRQVSLSVENFIEAQLSKFDSVAVESRTWYRMHRFYSQLHFRLHKHRARDLQSTS